MTLRVTEVSPMSGEFVHVEGAEFPNYVRYSADNWMYIVGESYEGAFDNEPLEKAYQIWKSKQ